MKSHKETFITLYKSESDKLFRYCWMRISSREQAIDTVQESFMKLWDALEKCRKDGTQIESQRAMLFAIARNLIIDWYRKKKSISLDVLMDVEDGSAMRTRWILSLRQRERCSWASCDLWRPCTRKHSIFVSLRTSNRKKLPRCSV